MDAKLAASLERMKDQYEAAHYQNHPDHARLMLDQLWRQIGTFLENRNQDPLLFAYSIRDERRAWTGLMNDVFAWSDAVLDADGPDVQSTGVH